MMLQNVLTTVPSSVRALTRLSPFAFRRFTISASSNTWNTQNRRQYSIGLQSTSFSRFPSAVGSVLGSKRFYSHIPDELDPLMDEHSIILTLCDAFIGYITIIDKSWQNAAASAEAAAADGAPAEIDTSGTNSGVNKEDLLHFVNFFRSYVVKGHQEKEEILFESVTAGRDSDHGLVPLLLQEHASFVELLNQLEQLATQNWDDIKVIQIAAKLCEMKDRHITREEKGLYPMVTNRLAREEIEDLGRRFEKMDQLWTKERKELEELARNLSAKYPWSQDPNVQQEQL